MSAIRKLAVNGGVDGTPAVNFVRKYLCGRKTGCTLPTHVVNDKDAIANIPETTAPGILQATFAAMINATFSPRRNVSSDQLAPGGRRPGMAAPTLDTQGEAR